MYNRNQRSGVDRGRRGLLRAAAACAAGLVVSPAFAIAQARVRELAFYNLHTGESLRTPYWEQGRYLPHALNTINFILRDHRNSKVRSIEPALLDLLWGLQQRVEAKGAFHVISGYRSPETNEQLRTRSGAVAKFSLHRVGRAIDIRLPGTPTGQLRKAAVALKQGGVGYYPQPDFIHVDTGRVRYW